jgi:6-pyruvoyltetrahydropterin/6-carboxytetrahydropterin synthase
MYQICKTYSFEAAHQLRDYDGDCARLHGHHWEVSVCIEGTQLDPVGMLVDFGEVKRAISATIGHYDHNFLNEIAPFDEVNPTAELLAQTIYRALRQHIAEMAPDARLVYVQVAESPTAWARYWE